VARRTESGEKEKKKEGRRERKEGTPQPLPHFPLGHSGRGQTLRIPAGAVAT